MTVNMIRPPQCSRYQLDVEYSQWRLTCDLMNYLITNYSHHKLVVYEFHNIIERFLMAMCNSSLRSRLQSPWTVYYHLTRTDPFVEQLHDELTNKCGVGKMAENIVEYIVYTINSFISKPPPKYEKVGVIKIYRHRMSYRSFMIDLTPLQIAKLKRHLRRDMMCMVIRYGAIIIKSQQWSVPLTLINTLYTNYNVRFEAFASPINNFLGDYKNAEYCSLFEDDQKFGSIGNIFDISMSSPLDGVKLDSTGWIVHPPYIPEIMCRAVDKINEGISNAKLRGAKMFVVLIIPYWPESEVYRKAKFSKHSYTEIVMTRHTHFYENHGRYINSSFDTAMFIFDDEKKDIVQYADIIGSVYIKNIPNKVNIPKSLKMLMNNNYQQITMKDKDDDTNTVVLNPHSTNRMTWRSKYNRENEHYVVRNKDISPLIVKII